MPLILAGFAGRVTFDQISGDGVMFGFSANDFETANDIIRYFRALIYQGAGFVKLLNKIAQVFARAAFDAQR